jgi:hypothetical protein
LPDASKTLVVVYRGRQDHNMPLANQDGFNHLGLRRLEFSTDDKIAEPFA